MIQKRLSNLWKSFTKISLQHRKISNLLYFAEINKFSFLRTYFLSKLVTLNTLPFLSYVIHSPTSFPFWKYPDRILVPFFLNHSQYPLQTPSIMSPLPKHCHLCGIRCVAVS